jgi:uncharacterized protein YbjT (DUF2867 family)
MDVAVIAEPGSGTGRLVRQLARCRGHRVVEEDPDAAVLIPGRSERADEALQALLARVAPGTRVLLVSSFAVGQPEHPFNRFTRGLPAAEALLRASGRPFTIVRATWLTDDPPGAHAVTVTRDDHVDGMLSRADLAEALVDALEQPPGETFALFNEPA